MRAILSFGRVALCASTAAVLAFACSSDNAPGGSDGGTPDSSMKGSGGKAGSGGASTGGKSSGGSSGTGGSGATVGTGGKVSAEAGIPDAGDGGVVAPSLCAGKTGADQIACGQYMVEHLDACGDCHTPRVAGGAPDTTKILAGNPSFADLDGIAGNGIGNLPAPNLTQLKTAKWTAQDVMDCILDGKRSAAHGGPVVPVMPYVTLHNMAKVDAEAIAAFILSLTPITNDIPAREPLPASIPAAALPVPPVDPTKIPDPVIDKSDPSYADAMFGKYLAAEAGVCMDCHTERLPNQQVDMSRPFGGGQPFVLGVPFGTVISANLTTDPTDGLKNWTPGLVKTLVKTGVNNNGDMICPPMPVGPQGAFGGLTDAHALAIGAYITHLPPVSNGKDSGGPFHLCLLTPPPGDAGAKDSGHD